MDTSKKKVLYILRPTSDRGGMGRIGKSVAGVMVCVVVIANLETNVMIHKKY